MGLFAAINIARRPFDGLGPWDVQSLRPGTWPGRLERGRHDEGSRWWMRPRYVFMLAGLGAAAVSSSIGLRGVLKIEPFDICRG
jgi:hypothetical protein